MDAYEIYIAWWRDHYGYECPITRDAWKQWCAQPRKAEHEQEHDITVEQREGWSYGD